ncbi:neuroligin-1-like [Aphis craccivora]|uniref:Neuroligin-1-like n=1 Tax=Aphis craccivora TaxID=307492 RepID=A0A6G0Z5F2_APHCR|nr:neuroligin-1-like [Aphis craccivora]
MVSSPLSISKTINSATNRFCAVIKYDMSVELKVYNEYFFSVVQEKLSYLAETVCLHFVSELSKALTVKYKDLKQLLIASFYYNSLTLNNAVYPFPFLLIKMSHELKITSLMSFALSPTDCQCASCTCLIRKQLSKKIRRSFANVILNDKWTFYIIKCSFIWACPTYFFLIHWTHRRALEASGRRVTIGIILKYTPGFEIRKRFWDFVVCFQDPNDHDDKPDSGSKERNRFRSVTWDEYDPVHQKISVAFSEIRNLFYTQFSLLPITTTTTVCQFNCGCVLLVCVIDESIHTIFIKYVRIDESTHKETQSIQ